MNNSSSEEEGNKDDDDIIDCNIDYSVQNNTFKPKSTPFRVFMPRDR